MLRNIFFLIKTVLIIFILLNNSYALELSIIPLKKPILNKKLEDQKSIAVSIKPKSKPINKTKK